MKKSEINIIFIIIAIIIVIITLSKYIIPVYIEIEINGRTYKVDQYDSYESAKMLDYLNMKSIEVIKLLRKKVEMLPNRGINNLTYEQKILIDLYDTLRKNYNPDALYERLKYYNHSSTSFSYNKGEQLVMCIRDKNGKIHEEHVIILVLLHELTHIAYKGWGHYKPFWLRYNIICDVIAQAQWYDALDVKEPICYCGKLTIPEREFQKLIHPKNLV